MTQSQAASWDATRTTTQPMKAVMFSHYGALDQLALGDIPPPLPREDKVLIRVQAAALHIGGKRCMSPI
jgi:hypothetical protein